MKISKDGSIGWKDDNYIETAVNYENKWNYVRFFCLFHLSTIHWNTKISFIWLNETYLKII